MEEYVDMVAIAQTQLTSLIAEGMFEAVPSLRITVAGVRLRRVPQWLWRFNGGGEFLAVRNTRPHQGAPLCLGQQFAAVESSPARRVPRLARERDDPLPVARLGVRPPHWQSWFDPKRTRPELRRRRRPRPRPLHGRDLAVEEERQVLYLEL